MESFLHHPFFFGEGILNTLHLFIGRWFDVFMVIITYTGDEIFYTLFLPVLYWCYHKRNTVVIGSVFLISITVNDMMKEIFQNPRPDPGKLLEGFRALSQRYMPEDPGFPSGHTQGSVTMWGSIMYLARNRAVLAVGILMIILVPYSRMYLGVHHLGDVIGGYVLGFLCLVTVIPLGLLAEKHYGRLREPLMVLLLLAVPFAVYQVIPGKSVYNYMGVLSGFLIGSYLAEKRIAFYPRNGVPATALKLLIGLAGLFLVKEGVKVLLPRTPLAGFMRYWLMGFWITFVAPLVFSRWALLRGKGEAHGGTSAP
ncbi:MAG: phosphatase PAP2 family protein [Spirochaetes bacterium]|nr:phosphatase PAP2 family protein [Spirochaetota bacterium]